MHQVITVYKDDEISRSSINSGIAGSRKSAIFLVYNLYSIISCCHFITNSATVICRTIVNDDDFGIMVVLPLNTFQTGWQILFHVVYGNDNADKGLEMGR